MVVEMDSQVAVQLVTRRQKTSGTSGTLIADRNKELMESFSSLQHVLREGNSAADHLANLGHNLPHTLCGS